MGTATYALPDHRLSTMNAQLLQDFIARERLPASYAEDGRRHLLPLAERLNARADGHAGPLLVGINGAQGTGKSTLSALIATALEARGPRVAVLSIDDFYVSRAARRELADSVHPLLLSRGVPGTHDVTLLRQTLDRLESAGAGDSIALPRFDKSIDEPLPQSRWPSIEGPVDLVILEGWCVGVEPQPEAALTEAVNELEAREDPRGVWRRHVNRRLAEDYAAVFERLDVLVLLRAPSFEQVYEWRSLQEQKLREVAPPGAPGLMDDAALRRFIQHFERLTRHALETLPQQADEVIELDAQHRVRDS